MHVISSSHGIGNDKGYGKSSCKEGKGVGKEEKPRDKLKVIFL